jgi:hypothetical protein
MNKDLEMIGKKFNDWTVVSFSHVKQSIYRGKPKSRGNYWNCVCKCGKERKLSNRALKTSKSCGCHFKRTQAKNKIKEGKTYGYLTVSEIIETGKWGIKCGVKCVCGTEFEVSGRNLRRDNSNYSCGCIGIKLDETATGFNSVVGYYKVSANHRNLDFTLGIEEFKKLTDSPCHYCGIKESNINRGYKYNGIDRIDSSKGYISENVVSCCKDCNIAKSTMSYEEYKSFIKRVYKFLFP